MSMIDMHSHALPNVDDGAKNVEESLLMLSDSFSQGVELCALTPHCIIHRQKDLEEFLLRRDRAFVELNRAMKEKGGSYPEVILGGEVYLDNNLNNYEGLERVCYTDTNVLLLEFPMENMNPRWAEWIYDMNRKGIKILVAHVDRYPEWEKMMADFSGLDVMYQINASRFLKFSDRKLLKSLMEYGHRYVVSSDMHNMRGRKCNMEDSFIKAKKKYAEKAEDFFCGNAKKVLKSR